MERSIKTELFIALTVFLGLSPTLVLGQTTVEAAMSQKEMIRQKNSWVSSGSGSLPSE
jgi:hypothetical protein